MQQRASTYSVLTHTLDSWDESKVKIYFSDSSQVALSNLWECSLEHHSSTYYVLTQTLDPCGGVKRSKLILQKEIILHIKVMGMELEYHANIFCPYTCPHPVDWV